MTAGRFKYIVVGGGFFGSTIAERIASDLNEKVLIIEKRDHIGGNCYSYEYPGTNIEVHKYGTHIFHTNNKEVWDYVNKFTEFNRYQHRVLTTCKHKVYSMPINLGTINAFYNLNLKPKDIPGFLAGKKKASKKPNNLEEKIISLIGNDLYVAFIKGYTTKQWGCDPKDLPPEIITRLPVRASYYDSYYDDYYQGLPLHGYTAMFEKMLKNIPVAMNTDFFDDRKQWKKHCDYLVYTGPIDRYFDYSLGKLQWRSVRFQLQKRAQEDFQGTSVMNYADIEYPYTRIHEPKHLHPERKFKPNSTVIIREYSCSNDKEPYYPVNSPDDKALFAKYHELARKEKNVIFGGRLGTYRYLDMDDTIAAALAVYESRIKKAG